MTTGIRCRFCGHADIRELDAGYMCLDHAACEGRRTTGAPNVHTDEAHGQGAYGCTVCRANAERLRSPEGSVERCARCGMARETHSHIAHYFVAPHGGREARCSWGAIAPPAAPHTERCPGACDLDPAHEGPCWCADHCQRTADDPIPLDAKTLAAIAAAKALPDPRPASASPREFPEAECPHCRDMCGTGQWDDPHTDEDCLTSMRGSVADGTLVWHDDPRLVSASRSNTSVLDVGCIECSVGRGRPCINEDGTARDIVHDDRLKRFAFEQQRSGSATPHTCVCCGADIPNACHVCETEYEAGRCARPAPSPFDPDRETGIADPAADSSSLEQRIRAFIVTWSGSVSRDPFMQSQLESLLADVRSQAREWIAQDCELEARALEHTGASTTVPDPETLLYIARRIRRTTDTKGPAT